MSHWRRLSRKHRALYLTLAVLALTATALASGRLTPSRTAVKSSGPSHDASLGGALPPPAGVFIRKTSAFPELGNVLVMVRLTPEQVAAKAKDGTASYVTLGEFGEILFRDDGESGDETAGDALYTAVAKANLDQLKARSEHDLRTLRSGGAKTLLFNGRVLAGHQTQEPFNFAGLQRGDTVPLNPAVVNVQTSSAFGPPDELQERVLMIRSPKVVADPERTVNPCDLSGNPAGVWTFNHLMTEMANQPATGLDPAVFTENWLMNWTQNQTINSFGVPSRMQMQSLINQWRAASGGGDLDLNLSPFRLLAIVPRLDLRRTTRGVGGYGGPGGGDFLDAGEARFVFGLVLPRGWKLEGGYDERNAPVLHENGCRALPFSVIFEYRIPRRGCEEVRNWAQRWADLDNFTPGSADYNDRLELLTEEFVTADANPSRPNGSAIGQVRTNEIALEAPWQLREFHLPTLPWSQLDETTANDTADDTFNNSAVFQSWILGQISPLLSSPWDQPIPEVPLVFPSDPFQGARPEMPTAGFFWDAPGLNLSPSAGNNADNWGRHRASLASCNGCHAVETGTKFVHIDPSTPGLPASISGFLTGITVADPAELGGLPLRSFSDLARRQLDLLQLAEISCVDFPSVDVGLVHTELIRTGRIPKNPFPRTVSSVSVGVSDMKANHITEVH